MRYSVHALLVIVLLLSCDSGEKLPTEALPPLTSVAMLEMSFGAENVPDEFIIWRIFGLSVSNLGDICVSQESHVLIFDKNGKPKTILGQQGQGPGDFQRAGSSNVSPTGHLSVSTGMYNRFNIYSPKLDFIKTVNFNINEQYRRFVSEMSRSSLGISEIFAINENDKVVKCKTEITTSESPFFQYDMILYEKYGEIHLLADYNSKSRLRVGSQRGGIPFFGELNCAMLPGNRVAYTHADHDFIIEKNLGYYILNVVSLDNLEVKPHNRWHFIQAVSKIAFRSLKDEAFDLVFHDGSHDWRQVERDIKSIWPMVKDGGLILVHDTENPVKDYKLYKALGHIRKDKVTLPFGYGLTIIKKHGGKVKVNLKWRKGK